MGDNTGIEWTDATWNPIAGCSIVSPGCTNCYAMRMAARLEAMGRPNYAGLTRIVNGKPVWTGKIGVANEWSFEAPLRWKRPRRVFVNSMSDLFHENVTEDTIDSAFGIMALTPQHTYQVLTKRPERMRAYIKSSIVPHHSGPATFDWPLPNVWLGVSVERQAEADERIPLLLDTPAAVRWISAEPLLGPVDLRPYLTGEEQPNSAGEATGWRPPLDWIVVGGESGPRARPSHPDWIRSLRDQCAAAGVPFFFKQWGEWLPEELKPDARETYAADLAAGRTWRFSPGVPMRRVGKKAAGATLDGREHREWPR